MNRRIFTCSMLSGALLLGAAALRAQEGPVLVAPPPEHFAMLQGGAGGDVLFAGPVGERIELLGFEGMHGAKVVTGAPFSAVAVSETTQTLADGNHISRTTRTNLFRDSQGRFRKEVTLPAIGPLATSGQPKSFVMINDPVANAHFILHPEDKTAEKMSHSFGGMKGPMAGAMKDGLKSKFGAHMQEGLANGTLKKDDLGTCNPAVNSACPGGVTSQGTRITHTIPAGQIGNEKPITIVSEHWYSNDLQMVVMSKRSDPRFGDTTYTLTNIQRAEPSAALFAVPSDFTVKEGGVGHHVMMQEKLPPPPPNE
jgi:hypothetical protein